MLSDGVCGLTDDSGTDDWRLPNFKELLSLVDSENYSPSIPNDIPILTVPDKYYWSSTTAAFNNSYALYVDMEIGGLVAIQEKDTPTYCVWPVRGGQF